MAVRFTKVSRNPNAERVTLEYHEVREAGKPDQYTAVIHCPPHADFVAAFDALVPLVFTLCELGDLPQKGTEVRGISVRWDDDAMGVTLSAVRKLRTSTKPLNLHTPFKSADGEGDDSLPDSAVALIEHALREAEAYLQGTKRGEPAQAELPV